jgi:hypothetical protein
MHIRASISCTSLLDIWFIPSQHNGVLPIRVMAVSAEVPFGMLSIAIGKEQQGKAYYLGD